MDIRTLVQSDLLAAQIFYLSNSRIVRHDNRLALRCRRFVADIDEVHTRGLSKDRWRFTYRAGVDCACVEPFQELRSGWEFEPLHGDALRCKPFVERTARLQNDKVAVLLITDAERFSRFLGARRLARQQCSGAGQDTGSACA